MLKSPDVYKYTSESIEPKCMSLWNTESFNHSRNSHHLQATCVLSTSSVNTFIYFSTDLIKHVWQQQIHEYFAIARRLAIAIFPNICYCQTSGLANFPTICYCQTSGLANFPTICYCQTSGLANFPTICYCQTSSNSHSVIIIIKVRRRRRRKKHSYNNNNSLFRPCKVDSYV